MGENEVETNAQKWIRYHHRAKKTLCLSEGKRKSRIGSNVSLIDFLGFLNQIDVSEFGLKKVPRSSCGQLSSPIFEKKKPPNVNGTPNRESSEAKEKALLSIVRALSHSEFGVFVIDQKRKGKIVQRGCMNGSDIVDFLFFNLKLCCRSEASAVATALLRTNMIESIGASSSKTFSDSTQFRVASDISHRLPQIALSNFQEDDELVYHPRMFAGGGIQLEQIDCNALFGQTWAAGFSSPNSVISSSCDPPGKRGIFFLKKGIVSVFKMLRGSIEKLVGTIYPYQLFGELSLFDVSPRLVTIFVASSHCEYLVLKVEELQSILLMEPRVAHRLFKGIGTHLAAVKLDLSSKVKTISPKRGARDEERVQKLMKNEEILLNFNVMYRKIVLKQSCVEVSASFITFSSELFGFNKREVLRLAEVTSIERVGSKIILHPRSSSKRLTFKVASVLVSKDILAKLTPIWKLALWKHYMAILELERSSDTVTCQTALSWLGNEIRSGKGHDVGFSEKNVTRLIYLMRSQEEPYNAAAATVLVHSVKANLYREFILVRGSDIFLKFLIEFAKEGWVEIHQPLDPADIHFTKVIGSGAAGDVWEAEWQGDTYAVKKIFAECLGGDLREFKSEVAIMSVLYHPNIVTCLAASLGSKPMLVCKLYELGSVLDVIKNQSLTLGRALVIQMACDAALGMRYLHSFGLIHRDLKPANLLVSKDWKVAVSDFGISRVLSLNMTKAVGSSIYIAPEVFDTNMYSKKVDIYGFSYILWGLWERKTPFENLREFELISKVCEEQMRPNVDPDCPFGNLMERCWAQDPNARPTFAKIVHELRKLTNQDEYSLSDPLSPRSSSSVSGGLSISRTCTISDKLPPGLSLSVFPSNSSPSPPFSHSPTQPPRPPRKQTQGVDSPCSSSFPGAENLLLERVSQEMYNSSRYSSPSRHHPSHSSPLVNSASASPQLPPPPPPRNYSTGCSPLLSPYPNPPVHPLSLPSPSSPSSSSPSSPSPSPCSLSSLSQTPSLSPLTNSTCTTSTSTESDSFFGMDESNLNGELEIMSLIKEERKKEERDVQERGSKLSHSSETFTPRKTSFFRPKKRQLQLSPQTSHQKETTETTETGASVKRSTSYFLPKVSGRDPDTTIFNHISQSTALVEGGASLPDFASKGNRISSSNSFFDSGDPLSPSSSSTNQLIRSEGIRTFQPYSAKTNTHLGFQMTDLEWSLLFYEASLLSLKEKETFVVDGERLLFFMTGGSVRVVYDKESPSPSSSLSSSSSSLSSSSSNKTDFYQEGSVIGGEEYFLKNPTSLFLSLISESDSTSFIRVEVGWVEKLIVRCPRFSAHFHYFLSSCFVPQCTLLEIVAFSDQEMGEKEKEKEKEG